MAEIVNGREIAQHINNAVKEKIEAMRAEYGKRPRLVSLTIGHSDEALIYMKMQEKTAERIGIEFVSMELDVEISQDDLISEIQKLNQDKSVTAMIIQKPLPFGIDHDRVIDAIAHEKDAEGLHPYNLGRIFRREADIVPCTPGAVMKLLDEYHVDLYGKEVVIIGHSAIVGKPLSLMMVNENATTTVCHIGTAEKGDVGSHARKADILIVAVGKPEMVKADWVKQGAIVIDVGINNVNGNLVGDVKFDEVSKKASIITPVPGGVGPITVSILMRNVLRAYRSQHVAV